METVARRTFESLAQELQMMIFDKLLENATEVISYNKPSDGSKKRVTFQRRIRDEVGDIIDVAGMLLLNKTLKTIILSIFAKLPKAIEVSSRDEARKLGILLKMRRSPLFDQITQAVFYLQPITPNSTVVVDKCLRSEFEGLEEVFLEHHKTMTIYEILMQKAAGVDQYLVKEVKEHFGKIVELAASEEFAVVLFTAVDFVLNSGRTEHKYIVRSNQKSSKSFDILTIS